MRRAHFSVVGLPLSSGHHSGTVTIEVVKDDALFKVRPKWRRRAYEMLLSDVAGIVITRVALQLAKEKRAAKKRRGSP
jgi:hypothetical protein